jgi:hypothetical protein
VKNIRFEKVHDLLALMNLCLPHVPKLELHMELLSFLNPFSVAFRYPGESATRDQAREAVNAIKQLRPILRRMLNLD